MDWLSCKYKSLAKSSHFLCLLHQSYDWHLLLGYENKVEWQSGSFFLVERLDGNQHWQSESQLNDMGWWSQRLEISLFDRPAIGMKKGKEAAKKPTDWLWPVILSRFDYHYKEKNPSFTFPHADTPDVIGCYNIRNVSDRSSWRQILEDCHN